MRYHPRLKLQLPAGIALLLGLLATGCSAPSEVDRDNRRLLDAILTAITMKNSIWLEDDARLAETRHSAGQLADADYAPLVSIIEKARLGDWQAAENLGYQFRKERPFVREGE
jgi:hypothetical protein